LDLVLLLELDHIIKRQLALFDGVIGSDHDRQFDETGSRHGPIGFVFERLASLEILNGNAGFTAMRFDRRHNPSANSRLRLFGGSCAASYAEHNQNRFGDKYSVSCSKVFVV
jgi:hypothetical protein